MHIEVVSLFPDLIELASSYGVCGRARERGLVHIGAVNPRDFANDRHRTVDDRPYGGGPGMVMMVEPLRAAIGAARATIAKSEPLADRAPVIYLSPQGEQLNQQVVTELAAMTAMVLLCGRYEGVDERLLQLEVDREISLGDFVLSGGELPALAVIDAVTRQLPGVLGHQDSAAMDSFADGLLDCPHYTRPEHIVSLTVPPVLLSGDHRLIEQWRLKQALGRTYERRPDLLDARELSENEQTLLREYLAERDS
tara:strand:- start:1181 stop:1939 length:759 start_codon:yes stop_codon:yes gene_type:complete